MVLKRDLVIFAVGIILVIIGLVYINNSDSLFSSAIDPLMPVNWDEVKERDIMKSIILVTLVEEHNGQCTITAPYFEGIIEHEYFTRGNELGNKLQFNSENSTIIVPCNELYGEKSRLEIWNVVPEASKHTHKYEYWIKPLN